MNSDYSASDTDVPTLVNLVVPGDPRKRQAQARMVEKPDTVIPSLTEPVHADAPEARSASLEKRIDRIVSEALVRHLNAARTEIATRIKSEVLSSIAKE